jgi:lysophospholipase L1-like esterase
MEKLWYRQPNIDGRRWDAFANNLRELRHARAQLVVLDLPIHPIFTDGIENSPIGAVDRRYRAKVAELCRELSVPLRQYGPQDLQTDDLDGVFQDCIHFNEVGAALMTDRVARDLAELQASGRIRLKCEQAACNAEPNPAQSRQLAAVIRTP